MPQVSVAAQIAGVRSGDYLASFPTDTVPALASRPDRAELIFAAKQRQPDKPLILMAATAMDLWPYVQGSETDWQIWQRLAARYWPGALTLVLPASSRLPQAINPQASNSPLSATPGLTVGLRIPAWEPALSLLQQTGPLATTSVNRSGHPPLTELAAINHQFPQVLTPTASNWQLPSTAGTPSTVIRWSEAGWEVLRQGAIQLPPSEIEFSGER